MFNFLTKLTKREKVNILVLIGLVLLLLVGLIAVRERQLIRKKAAKTGPINLNFAPIPAGSGPGDTIVATLKAVNTTGTTMNVSGIEATVDIDSKFTYIDSGSNCQFPFSGLTFKLFDTIQGQKIKFMCAIDPNVSPVGLTFGVGQAVATITLLINNNASGDATLAFSQTRVTHADIPGQAADISTDGQGMTYTIVGPTGTPAPTDIPGSCRITNVTATDLAFPDRITLTWTTNNSNDPNFDHIAIRKDGVDWINNVDKSFTTVTDQPRSCGEAFWYRVFCAQADGTRYGSPYVVGDDSNPNDAADTGSTTVCVITPTLPPNPTPTPTPIILPTEPFPTSATPINTPVPTQTPIPTPTRTPTPIPTSGPSPTSQPTPTLQPSCTRKGEGDSNCDGVINGIDYSIFVNTQCAKTSPQQICSDLRADFDRDTDVDQVDKDTIVGSLTQ